MADFCGGNIIPSMQEVNRNLCEVHDTHRVLNGRRSGNHFPSAPSSSVAAESPPKINEMMMPAQT